MIGTRSLSPEVVGLRQAMDQLLDESFVGGPFRTLWSQGRAGTGAPAAPLPLDVYATQDAFVIAAAVPGLRPDDLEVTYSQGTVVLSGAVGAAETTGVTWYARELWHGRFQRAVSLPFEVDPDKAEASFEHGILRIRLPKAEHAKPRRIPIQVTAGGTTQAIGEGDPAADQR